MSRALPIIAALLLQVSTVARADVLALCYHDVTATTEEALRDETAVSVERLVSQLNWLLANGYTPVSMSQIREARAGGTPLPPQPVLLTFDDGYSSFQDRVMPLLKLYGLPAVLAPVTSWVDAEPGSVIDYGDLQVPRERFLTWTELKEIAGSGLVEIASHSHDLHHGIPGNPQGNTQPAASTLAYDAATGRYESPAELLERVRADLEKSAALIETHVGYRPQVMVWPYGEYGAATRDAAEALGMTISMTLDDIPNSPEDPGRLHRLLLGSDMELSEFATAVRDLYTPTPVRAAHVDLDYVYDPDPVQQEKNLGDLLDRIKAMNLSTVILQAFADPDGDGAADALYFPNRHLPVREDLFNRVAWQLKTRAGVRVFAWLPVLAYTAAPAELPRVETVDPDGYLIYPRLSPFAEDGLRMVEEVYEDLAASSNVAGILFHDDAVLSDYEDASPAALRYYREQWGLPDDIQAILAEHHDEFSRLKTRRLIEITGRLAAAVHRYRPAALTARNLYAPVILSPESETWFAQNYALFLETYDYTAVLAMPYLEDARDPEAWLERLIARVAAEPLGLEKTLFELQTVDWRTPRKLADAELTRHMDVLLNRGARHIAYYPDDFVVGAPRLETLRSRLSVNDYAALVE